mmetsp:Transcript_10587/g.22791  ORF Transcript_10587/g.22791 Transcript_10587/m.22791 type:complete len:413 (-) Transcript_10587:669-1907(-)
MGCVSSKSGAIGDGMAANSRTIDNYLKRAKQDEQRKIKMLLLGAGDSGKSTIFKQMRLLYGAERSDDELRMFGVVVRSNIVYTMRKLCSLLHNMGLEANLDMESREAEKHGGGIEDLMTCREAYDDLRKHLLKKNIAETAQDHVSGSKRAGRNDWVGHSPRAGQAANNNAEQFLEHYESIRILWRSATMKKVWDKRAAINVFDAHQDLLDSVTRIASPDYKPSVHDVLISRVRTTEVVNEKYMINGALFEMYDVGGQRSERRKWIDFFDDVTAVIFVAALSEYDQALAEARRSNRMVESIELFRSVCNNHAFENTSIILFLNKKDLFAQKILRSDISAQRPFRDFDGPRKNFDSGVSYFTQRFKNCLISGELNDSFIHVTCATDTNNMEFVLTATRKIVQNENLKRSGLGID